MQLPTPVDDFVGVPVFNVVQIWGTEEVTPFQVYFSCEYFMSQSSHLLTVDLLRRACLNTVDSLSL